jgi:ATP-dependent Clp endopeptidase proteolytic subunit ClpP
MPDIKSMRERVRNLATAGRWYDIRNADDDTATVRIYDEIGYWGVTEEQFARDLAAVSASEITVQISSPGGDVFAGVAIYNALRAHSARITTRVDGVAASIASVISQAGDTRVILSGAQMMIHEAWGLAIGNATEMREMADVLERQNVNIANIYAARSGGDADKFLELMSSGDTWLTAAEAVELGLADEVVDPKPKDKPKDSLTVDVEISPSIRKAIEDAVKARLDQTPQPAPQVEETPGDETGVDSEAAERLLAAFTLNQEEA